MAKKEWKPWTVADLVKRLQSLPQGLPVAVPCYSREMGVTDATHGAIDIVAVGAAIEEANGWVWNDEGMSEWKPDSKPVLIVTINPSY